MNGRRRNDDAASHTCTCSYARGPRYPVKVAPGKHFDMSQHPVHPWHWMRQCSPRPGPGSYHSCVFSLLHLFYSHSPLFHTHAHAHTHTHTYLQVCAYTRPVHRLTESPFLSPLLHTPAIPSCSMSYSIIPRPSADCRLQLQQGPLPLSPLVCFSLFLARSLRSPHPARSISRRTTPVSPPCLISPHSYPLAVPCPSRHTRALSIHLLYESVSP